MKFLFFSTLKGTRKGAGLSVINGQAAFAINPTGIAYGWGQGATGILGNGQIVVQSAPTAVQGRLFSYISTGGNFTGSNNGNVVGLEMFTGRAYTWGNNSAGQLGTGLAAQASSPVSVAGGRSFSQIVNASLFMVGLEGSTGLAWAWGGNASGNLGDGTTASRSSPVSVLGGRSYSQLAADLQGHTVYAIEGSTGFVWAWGEGVNGNLGNNLVNSTSSPVSVAGTRSFSQVVGIEVSAIALEASTGFAYSWGGNNGGQLGINSVNATSSPTSVVGGRSYSQINMAVVAASNLGNCVALEGSTGHAYAWGNNGFAQLGDNTITNRSSPVSVVGGRSFSQTYTLGQSSFAIEGSTGNVYSWGANELGSLGVGDLNNRSSPTIVAGARSVSALYAPPAGSPGASPVILVKEASTGQVFGWGNNSNIQLAYSNTQYTPVSVVGGYSFSQVNSSGSGTFTIAIEASTGLAWTWGQNANGQLGNSSLQNTSSPISVFGARSYSQINTGNSAAYAIEASTGNAYAWGLGTSDQLGNNTGVNASIPSAVAGGRSFNQIATNFSANDNVFAIEASTGTVYGWGLNTAGQTGNYISSVNAASPLILAAVFVGGRSFSQVISSASANTIFGIEGSTGFLYGWGSGSSGVIGNNSTATEYSTTLIPDGRSYSTVNYTNGSFTLALEASTGNAYAWGTGSSGQLGSGNTNGSSSPVSVVGGRSYSQIDGNTAAIVAIEGSTGLAWTWGQGGNGAIGNGSLAGQSAPTSVFGGRSYKAIATDGLTVLAIEGSTGNVFGWGLNTGGQLGQQLNLTNAATPVSLAALLTASKSFSQVIAQANIDNGYAIEGSTGNIYAWGPNASGQVGNLGPNATVFAATLVVGGRSFSQISNNGSSQVVLALEASTGQGWAWGSNSQGALGTASGVLAASSPISVFGTRSYKQIFAGFSSSFGLEASTGNLYAWGANSTGTLGFNTLASSTTPASVVGGRSYSAFVTDGSSVVAIDGSTGNLFAWGTNTTQGQLGFQLNGLNASSPTSVAALLTSTKSFNQIFATPNASVQFGIEASTGFAWGWGTNNNGQLGNNTNVNQFAALSVVGARSFKTLSVGYSSTSGGIEASTGLVWMWGTGSSGVLGNNTGLQVSSPVSVFGGRSYKALLTVGSLSYGLEASTGNVYSWGTGGSGQLGINSAIVGSSTPVSVVGARSYSQLISDGTTTVALEASTGLAYSWGGNATGQIGDNTLANRSSPTSVVGGRSFNQILSNLNGSFYGIEGSTGHAYAWGQGTSGQLGNNLGAVQSSPVSVVGGRSFKSISTYTTSLIALEGSTGNAYTWGTGTSGQLGNNLVTPQSSPVSVVGGRSFASAFSNFSTVYAIEGSTGNMYAWGANATGNLGTGALISASSPVSVVGGRSFKAVVVGGNPVGLDSATGFAFSWGSGGASLGQYTNTASNPTPSSVLVITGLRSFTQISVGSTAFYAIEGSTGNAYGWGLGTSGQIGNNQSVTISSPSLVVGGRSYKQLIATNNSTVIAIEASTGNAYTWGSGSGGQLGNGAALSQSSPVSVSGGRSYSQISYTNNTGIMGLEASTGLAWGWGTNNVGQLGIGTIATPILTPTAVVGGKSYRQIVGGSTFFLAYEGSTGFGWTWGGNGSAGLGNYSTANQSSPTSVIFITGLRSFNQISANLNSGFFALEGSTGNAYSWGLNTSGQLGNNTTTTPFISPTLVAGARSYSQIQGLSSDTIAIEASTGNAYTWGLGSSGQLGNNSNIAQSSPISVSGARSFTQISMLPTTNFALEGSTGNIYSWGAGTNGFLGTNTTANASVPTVVAGGRSYKQITNSGGAVAALEASTGTIFTWGVAGNGELGNYDVINKSSPVSVVFLTGARSFIQVVSNGLSSAALEGSTGNVYTWGANTSGVLGNQSATATSSPVSVVGGKSFSQIGISSDPFIIGIEGSTGNAWGWGTNVSGQLGVNVALTAQSSPVSVAGGRSFSQISTDGSSTLAIEGSTGSVYGWGLNTQGQLGDGTASTRSSPVLALGGRSYSQVLLFGDIGGAPVAYALEASTGLIYVWGAGGTLGSVGTANQSSPVLVTNPRSVSSLSQHGYNNGVMLEASTGQAFMWGNVSSGNLGNNLDNFMASPISIAGILGNNG